MVSAPEFVWSRTARRTGFASTRAVVLIGLISGALYALVDFAERGMYLNGLRVDLGGVSLRGDPADPGRFGAQLALHTLALVGLFALYAWLLRLGRQGGLEGRWTRRLVLGIPLAFYVGFLFTPPYLSIDSLSYLAYGYLGTLAGGNPYIQTADTVTATPFGPRIVLYGWAGMSSPTPYGPLWTLLHMLVLHVTQDVALGLAITKSLLFAAVIGTAIAIHATLARVQPQMRLVGTLAFLWNPLIVIQLGAEGHVDGLMILFVVASLGLLVARRPAASVASAGLGVLTKFIPLMFVPAELMYAWRTEPRRRHLVLRVLLGAAISAGLAVALYAPFWAGPQTFAASLGMSVDNTLGPGAETYSVVVRATQAIVFVPLLLLISWRVRDTDSLLRASAGIATLYALIGSAAFWPWYVALPIALLSLVPGRTATWMLVVLGLCAMLQAPAVLLRNNGFITESTFLWTVRPARLIPMAALVLLTVLERWPNTLIVVRRRLGRLMSASH